MAYEVLTVKTATGTADIVVDTLASGQKIQVNRIDVGTDTTQSPWTGSVVVSSLPTLPAGSNNIGDVDVLTLPSLPSGSNAIGKLAANSGVDIGDVDDPVSQALLTTIKSLLGDSVATQIWKVAAYTTTQAGVAIWTPASTKKIAITHLTVTTYGTTAGRAILWFGASGDTTYSSGTDQPVFIGSFSPSTSSSPGAILQPENPIISANQDYILRYTCSTDLSIDIIAYGYEI